MNCDQVFDILTRGPFPTGTSCDMPVEAHLSSCAECRRLAEALRPAVELFQEAVDPEESRDLPGYWCAVATDRQSPALSYARETESQAALPLSDPHAEANGHWAGQLGWRMAAMLAIGVTVGALFSSGALQRMDFSRQGVASLVGSADNHGLASGRSQRMEAALVPAACYRLLPESGARYTMSEPQLLAGAELGHLSCCSGCHNSASDTVSRSSTVRVAQSCQMCHSNRNIPSLSAAP